jgi:hypothetical protein
MCTYIFYTNSVHFFLRGPYEIKNLFLNKNLQRKIKTWARVVGHPRNRSGGGRQGSNLGIVQEHLWSIVGMD